MEPNLSITIPVGVALGISSNPSYIAPFLMTLYMGLIAFSLCSQEFRIRRQLAFWFGIACFYGSIVCYLWPLDTLYYVAIAQMGCYLAVF